MQQDHAHNREGLPIEFNLPISYVIIYPEHSFLLVEGIYPSENSPYANTPA